MNSPTNTGGDYRYAWLCELVLVVNPCPPAVFVPVFVSLGYHCRLVLSGCRFRIVFCLGAALFDFDMLQRAQQTWRFSMVLVPPFASACM